nr:DNA translocase FtsK [Achromobacter insolitus]
MPLEGDDDGDDSRDAIDPLYMEAVTLVRRHGRASISLIQRHLRIGYNRAARLLESMELAGAVTAMQSNGSRELRA